MAFYRAEYESKALEDGELELEKGDLVYIQNPKKMFIDKDKKWAKGFSLRLEKEGAVSTKPTVRGLRRGMWRACCCTVSCCGVWCTALCALCASFCSLIGKPGSAQSYPQLQFQP